MAAYGAEINRFGPGGVIFAVTSADGDAPSLSQLLRVSDGAELLRAPGMVRDLSFSQGEAAILVVRNGRVERWQI